MGKSFANFMCKKFFHPSSYANIKRVWLAEERHDSEKKKQEGLRAEYEREQEIFDNRTLMGDVRVKHGLTFMYEPPKGLRLEDKKGEDQEYKFEWQRDTPIDAEVQDQPSESAVENVKCTRCHKWGHVSTDRECPLSDQSKDEEVAGPSTDQTDLMDDMRRDGLTLKQNVMGRRVNEHAHNQKFVGSSDEEEDIAPEEAFLKSLSMKEKKKLLKKLEKMEKKQKRLGSAKSKNKDKKKMKKKSRKISESSGDGSEDSDKQRRDRRNDRGGERRRHKGLSESSVDDSDQDRRGKSSSNHLQGERRIKIEPESDRGEERRRKGNGRRRDDERRVKKEPLSDSEEDRRKRHGKESKRGEGKRKIKQEKRSRSRSVEFKDRRGEKGRGHLIERSEGHQKDDRDRRRDREGRSTYDDPYNSHGGKHHNGRNDLDRNGHRVGHSHESNRNKEKETREVHSKKRYERDGEDKRDRRHDSGMQRKGYERMRGREDEKRSEKRRRRNSSSKSSDDASSSSSEDSSPERRQKRRR